MKAFYGYFDPTEEDSREYVADELAELSRARGGTGVGDGLSGSPAGGLTVSVSPGHAMIDGYVYSLIDDNSGPEEMTLSVAGSAERIDRLVLRLDLSANARSIRLLVLEGVPAASPVPPDITRSELVKEISLCQVRVRAAAWDILEEDITDERLDAEVCGMLISGQLAAVLNGKMSVQSGEALSAALEALEATIAKKASTATYFALLPASGWSETRPYTQTIDIPPDADGQALLESDRPFVFVAENEDARQEKAQRRAFGLFAYDMTIPAEGVVQAVCAGAKPRIDVQIELKVVR